MIILNGAPRSGKSSSVRAIQDTFEGVWVNLGVDVCMRMTPTRYLPGIGLRPGGERPDLEPVVRTLYLAMYESMAVHSRLSINVAADVGHHDGYTTPLAILPACARILAGLPVLFAVVRERREAAWLRAEPPTRDRLRPRAALAGCRAPAGVIRRGG